MDGTARRKDRRFRLDFGQLNVFADLANHHSLLRNGFSCRLGRLADDGFLIQALEVPVKV